MTCCDQIGALSCSSTTENAETKPEEASGTTASIAVGATKFETASQSGVTDHSGTKPGGTPEAAASAAIDMIGTELAAHSDATKDPGAKPGEAPDVTASITIDTTKLEIGTRLHVKFDDGVWYPGTIEKKVDGQYKYGILYDDGEREEVVIKEMPSHEFMGQKQSLFNIRVWRTVMSMTKHNSAVLREHEASRKKLMHRANDMPGNICKLWWQVVWAQQAGFPAWPSFVVVCLVLALSLSVCMCVCFVACSARVLILCFPSNSVALASATPTHMHPR